MTDHPDKLYAKEFILIDDEEVTRASLAVDDGGQAALHFFDRNGAAKLSVGAGQDGQALLRFVGKKEALTQISMDDETGNFHFVSYDMNGSHQFQLTVAGDGSHVMLGFGGEAPVVALTAANGKGEIAVKGKILNI